MTADEDHDICSRLAEIGIVAGNRVRFTEPIDRYPHDIVEGGESGVIEYITDGTVAIRLDNYHRGFDEWSNQVHFYYDNVPEHIDELKTLKVLLVEQPEVG